jgi:hypothetical protein
MKSMVLQDWLTIRGNSTVTSVTQTESQWIDVSQYQDATFWLIFRELNLGGGMVPSLTLNFQTAPEKDERLFASMSSLSLASLSVSAVTTVAVISSRFLTNTSIALGAWLRWNLTSSGASGTWDVTFRLDVALNGAMVFPQQPVDSLRVGQGG